MFSGVYTREGEGASMECVRISLQELGIVFKSLSASCYSFDIALGGD